MNMNNSFSDFCTDFFSNNNCDTLLYQLQKVDESGIKGVGDFTAIGCEFILNGMNTGTGFYSLGELMEAHFGYDNHTKHYFEFLNKWDSFCFYSPDDFRGLIFDFGELYTNNKVICYNGLNGPANIERVDEYTIEEFLKEYGLSRLYSITHWNVNWKKLGVNWNN